MKNPNTVTHSNLPSTAAIADLVVNLSSQLPTYQSLDIPSTFDPVKYALERVHQMYAERWEQSCPELFKETDFNHPSLAPYRVQIERVVGWLPNQAWGLFLSGPTGRGKTRAFWALLKRLLNDEHVDVKILSATEFYSRLQEQIYYGRDEALSWIDALAKHPVLAVEDWGQEAVLTGKKDWSEAYFLRLIDKRMGDKKPMLITSNLDAEQIVIRQGAFRADPLIRRLTESCEIVKF
ncbi:MAG: ATP-binding protein [Kiritimatiellales bacterium]|nr:ATP-binding protein [Kiritimatiellales bacterium]